MTTEQASKSSGKDELPFTDHRKIECHFDRDLGPVESPPGRHVSSIYLAGYAVSTLLDAGVW
jgi:hypothetical protein